MNKPRRSSKLNEHLMKETKYYEEKLYMLDVYSRLAQAEEEIHEGKAIDARKALKDLKAKYGL